MLWRKNIGIAMRSVVRDVEGSRRCGNARKADGDELFHVVGPYD